MYVSGNNEGEPWPSSSAHASLAGPVDLDTFRIKEDVWPEALSKTSMFIKLGNYLLPENDRPPHKGVHPWAEGAAGEHRIPNTWHYQVFTSRDD
ncbi:hypothetical protein B0H63DRAFT_486012 [Podospora didyma]|uniref:Uncharacterized protein n=1 Tax=Podospora didyma TaxID=330526 RepID=A0AAE0N433_9PEZI|nr:hypothetical protein B0H63DRAFT_486012 [Podospora didyma]